MSTSVKLSEEEWKAIKDAYCASGMSVVEFHQKRIHLLCPGGRSPGLNVTYKRLQGLSPFGLQTPGQGQVDIVDLGSTAPSPQSGTCSCKCSTDSGEPSHGTVRLVLPQGVRVEIDTPSPEAFLAAVIERIGGVR